MKIDKTKIESYHKTLQTTAPFTYTSEGVYFGLAGSILTEEQLKNKFNLILIGTIFYYKPLIVFNMNSTTIHTKYFETDVAANTYETDNLTPLAFLVI